MYKVFQKHCIGLFGSEDKCIDKFWNLGSKPKVFYRLMAFKYQNDWFGWTPPWSHPQIINLHTQICNYHTQITNLHTQIRNFHTQIINYHTQIYFLYTQIRYFHTQIYFLYSQTRNIMHKFTISTRKSVISIHKFQFSNRKFFHHTFPLPRGAGGCQPSLSYTPVSCLLSSDFWLLPSDFCLLPSVFCILNSPLVTPTNHQLTHASVIRLPGVLDI